MKKTMKKKHPKKKKIMAKHHIEMFYRYKYLVLIEFPVSPLASYT